jgi:hypothetical protein
VLVGANRWTVALALSTALTCVHRTDQAELPASLRGLPAPPPSAAAIGTAGLANPADNVVAMHRLDGTTVALRETAFVPTPDPMVVPIISPVKWPAVFAQDKDRLWVWAAGSWGWVNRADAHFLPYRPPGAAEGSDAGR